MTALLLYVAAIAQDGDWQNDWITHLPHVIRPSVLVLGHLLALILGS
jgi:hypothetical protein